MAIEMKKEIDFAAIEAKWQKKWLSDKINESEPDKRKKFFLIFAYPGISGFLHVGHMRGYTYSDVITRVKRMQGYNVIFPVGTHATGNQAIAFAEKLKKKDKDWINYLKINGCSEKDMDKMTNPRAVVDYFNRVYVEDYWKKFGFLADYRRFTCTVNEDYGKFIEWQFKKLNENKLLVQKPYFATACPKHGPVAVDPSETDISKGGNAEKVEFTILKFEFNGKYLVAATLRPETIYGQTNLWVNPNIKYVEAKVGDEIWILSEEAVEKLMHQRNDVKKIGFTKEKLIGEHALAPMIKRKLIILPSNFVDADVGTGIVTSVPSDAPYDYVALKELQDAKETDKKRWGFGIKQIEEIENIEIIPIIKTGKYGDKAAVKVCEESEVFVQDDPRLEQLTQEVYKAGFHDGVMLEVCGPYAGMKVFEAKEKVKEDLIQKKMADIMYDLSEEVLCRCGEKVCIKRIEDQWFIKYSDENLKKAAKEHAKDMTILPKEYHANLPSIIDWFQDRACSRMGNWLGTKLPMDSKWIIEPISDSTLYPIYYLVSKYANDKKIKPEQMNEAFFDYVYLGKGNIEKVAKECRVERELIEKIRKDVEYYYPLDMNLGGKEHQTVHFPVFLMNHVGILDKKYWPCGIFVNWWIIGKGSKISKSKGGAEPIPGAIEKYSVDGMRLYYSHVGSPNLDIVWDEGDVLNYKNAIRKIFEFISNMKTSKNEKPMDAWIESKINVKIKEATDAIEKYDLRNYSEMVFFGFFNDFKKYLGSNNNSNVVKYVCERWIKLISPVCPHIAEELWAKMGNKGFVSLAEWPQADENKIDEKLEQAEKNVEKSVGDILNILKIVKEKEGKEGEKVYVYVLPMEIKNYDSGVLSKRIGKKVEVFAVNDKKKYDPAGKAGKAKPGKPGIYVE